MALKHLGTEEYKDGRWGFKQVGYYLDGNMVEERSHQERTGKYVVRRHIGFTPQEIDSITTAIAAADGVQAKSNKKHNAIASLLGSKPNVTAYIDAAEIDKPGRSVNIIMSTNMPFTMNQDEFSHYFAIRA